MLLFHRCYIHTSIIDCIALSKIDLNENQVIEKLILPIYHEICVIEDKGKQFHNFFDNVNTYTESQVIAISLYRRYSVK